MSESREASPDANHDPADGVTAAAASSGPASDPFAGKPARLQQIVLEDADAETLRLIPLSTPNGEAFKAKFTALKKPNGNLVMVPSNAELGQILRNNGGHIHLPVAIRDQLPPEFQGAVVFGYVVDSSGRAIGVQMKRDTGQEEEEEGEEGEEQQREVEDMEVDEEDEISLGAATPAKPQKQKGTAARDQSSSSSPPPPVRRLTGTNPALPARRFAKRGRPRAKQRKQKESDDSEDDEEDEETGDREHSQESRNRGRKAEEDEYVPPYKDRMEKTRGGTRRSTRIKEKTPVVQSGEECDDEPSAATTSAPATDVVVTDKKEKVKEKERAKEKEKETAKKDNEDEEPNFDESQVARPYSGRWDPTRVLDFDQQMMRRENKVNRHSVSKWVDGNADDSSTRKRITNILSAASAEMSQKNETPSSSDGRTIKWPRNTRKSGFISEIKRISSTVPVEPEDPIAAKPVTSAPAQPYVVSFAEPVLQFFPKETPTVDEFVAYLNKYSLKPLVDNYKLKLQLSLRKAVEAMLDTWAPIVPPRTWCTHLMTCKSLVETFLTVWKQVPKERPEHFPDPLKVLATITFKELRQSWIKKDPPGAKLLSTTTATPGSSNQAGTSQQRTFTASVPAASTKQSSNGSQPKTIKYVIPMPIKPSSAAHTSAAGPRKVLIAPPRKPVSAPMSTNAAAVDWALYSRGSPDTDAASSSQTKQLPAAAQSSGAKKKPAPAVSETAPCPPTTKPFSRFTSIIGVSKVDTVPVEKSAAPAVVEHEASPTVKEASSSETATPAPAVNGTASASRTSTKHGFDSATKEDTTTPVKRMAAPHVDASADRNQKRKNSPVRRTSHNAATGECPVSTQVTPVSVDKSAARPSTRIPSPIRTASDSSATKGKPAVGQSQSRVATRMISPVRKESDQSTSLAEQAPSISSAKKVSAAVDDSASHVPAQKQVKALPAKISSKSRTRNSSSCSSTLSEYSPPESPVPRRATQRASRRTSGAVTNSPPRARRRSVSNRSSSTLPPAKNAKPATPATPETPSKRKRRNEAESLMNMDFGSGTSGATLANAEYGRYMPSDSSASGLSRRLSGRAAAEKRLTEVVESVIEKVKSSSKRKLRSDGHPDESVNDEKTPRGEPETKHRRGADATKSVDYSTEGSDAEGILSDTLEDGEEEVNCKASTSAAVFRNLNNVVKASAAADSQSLPQPTPRVFIPSTAMVHLTRIPKSAGDTLRNSMSETIQPLRATTTKYTVTSTPLPSKRPRAPSIVIDDAGEDEEDDDDEEDNDDDDEEGTITRVPAPGSSANASSNPNQKNVANGSWLPLHRRANGVSGPARASSSKTLPVLHSLLKQSDSPDQDESSKNGQPEAERTTEPKAKRRRVTRAALLESHSTEDAQSAQPAPLSGSSTPVQSTASPVMSNRSPVKLAQVFPIGYSFGNDSADSSPGSVPGPSGSPSTSVKTPNKTPAVPRNVREMREIITDDETGLTGSRPSTQSPAAPVLDIEEGNTAWGTDNHEADSDQEAPRLEPQQPAPSKSRSKRSTPKDVLTVKDFTQVMGRVPADLTSSVFNQMIPNQPELKQQWIRGQQLNANRPSAAPYISPSTNAVIRQRGRANQSVPVMVRAPAGMVLHPPLPPGQVPPGLVPIPVHMFQQQTPSGPQRVIIRRTVQHPDRRSYQAVCVSDAPGPSGIQAPAQVQLQVTPQVQPQVSPQVPLRVSPQVPPRVSPQVQLNEGVDGEQRGAVTPVQKAVQMEQPEGVQPEQGVRKSPTTVQELVQMRLREQAAEARRRYELEQRKIEEQHEAIRQRLQRGNSLRDGEPLNDEEKERREAELREQLEQREAELRERREKREAELRGKHEAQLREQQEQREQQELREPPQGLQEQRSLREQQQLLHDQQVLRENQLLQEQRALREQQLIREQELLFRERDRRMREELRELETLRAQEADALREIKELKFKAELEFRIQKEMWEKERERSVRPSTVTPPREQRKVLMSDHVVKLEGPDVKPEPVELYPVSNQNTELVLPADCTIDFRKWKTHNIVDWVSRILEGMKVEDTLNKLTESCITGYQLEQYFLNDPETVKKFELHFNHVALITDHTAVVVNAWKRADFQAKMAAHQKWLSEQPGPSQPASSSST